MVKSALIVSHFLLSEIGIIQQRSYDISLGLSLEFALKGTEKVKLHLYRVFN